MTESSPGGRPPAADRLTKAISQRVGVDPSPDSDSRADWDRLFRHADFPALVDRFVAEVVGAIERTAPFRNRADAATEGARLAHLVDLLYRDYDHKDPNREAVIARWRTEFQRWIDQTLRAGSGTKPEAVDWALQAWEATAKPGSPHPLGQLIATAVGVVLTQFPSLNATLSDRSPGAPTPPAPTAAAAPVPDSPPAGPPTDPASGREGSDASAGGSSKRPAIPDPAAPSPPTAPARPEPPPKPPAGPPRPQRLPPGPWTYKPVPEGPDKHTEYEGRSGFTPDRLRIVGGRVRGKKHKHEGTNCDDWFEFRNSGPWTILAVSDGGGSYQFSRIGARISCQTVVDNLAEAVTGPELTDLAAEAARARPEALGQLVERYREVVGRAIQKAMREALGAVQKKIQELNSALEYHRQVSRNELRPLSLRDFYHTLLVAILVPLRVGDKTYSLIIGCGCGDGMIAVVTNQADPREACKLLMKPDSGEFSGEVDFLTEKALSDDSIKARVYPGVFGGFKALLLMTDGVADDYFPNNPGMVSLYGDLVLNRVVDPPPEVPESDLLAALRETKVPSLDEFKALPINEPVYRFMESGPQAVEVASLALLADRLGVERPALALNATVLGAARRLLADPHAEITSREERLIHWLDAYTIRGSFDDRTLVVLSPATEP